MLRRTELISGNILLKNQYSGTSFKRWTSLCSRFNKFDSFNPAISTIIIISTTTTNGGPLSSSPPSCDHHCHQNDHHHHHHDHHCDQEGSLTMEIPLRSLQLNYIAGALKLCSLCSLWDLLASSLASDCWVFPQESHLISGFVVGERFSSVTGYIQNDHFFGIVHIEVNFQTREMQFQKFKFQKRLPTTSKHGKCDFKKSNFTNGFPQDHVHFLEPSLRRSRDLYMYLNGKDRLTHQLTSSGVGLPLQVSRHSFVVGIKKYSRGGFYWVRVPFKLFTIFNSVYLSNGISMTDYLYNTNVFWGETFWHLYVQGAPKKTIHSVL